ncbi:MAG: ribosome assembly RNA-binding protein YhbY [Clostridiales bacterium]|jgi:RNA-binding protein|nr:ribosome assembly RNA-binding protein YhbY [Clostridiales bacterium]
MNNEKALTGKQRAYLRGLANGIEPVLQIGKQGVTPETVDSLNEVLEARELVKAAVLQNCDEEPRSVAETLAGRARAEIVQVIGRKIVLYRRSKEKQGITLPKSK